jgi:hypothetical protein
VILFVLFLKLHQQFFGNKISSHKKCKNPVFFFFFLVQKNSCDKTKQKMKVTYSTVLDAPVEKIWAVMRRFAHNPDPDTDHPIKVELSEGKSEFEVGPAVRIITLPDGGKVVERLIAIDDDKFTLTYRILESPLPVKDYTATFRLWKVVETNQTFAEWYAIFEPTVAPGTSGAPDYHAMLQGIFKGLLYSAEKNVKSQK